MLYIVAQRENPFGEAPDGCLLYTAAWPTSVNMHAYGYAQNSNGWLPASSNESDAYLQVNHNTITWYYAAGSSAVEQANTNGTVYKYIVLG